MKSKIIIIILSICLVLGSVSFCFAAVGTGKFDDFTVFFKSGAYYEYTLYDVTTSSSVSHSLYGDGFFRAVLTPGHVYRISLSAYDNGYFYSHLSASSSSSFSSLIPLFDSSVSSPVSLSNTKYFVPSGSHSSSIVYDYFTFAYNPNYVKPTLPTLSYIVEDNILKPNSSASDIITGASFYLYYSSDNLGSYNQVDQGSSPQFTLKNSGYYYVIQSRNNISSDPSNIVYYHAFESPTGVSLSNNVLSWNTLADAVGYEVGVSKSGLLAPYRTISVLGNRLDLSAYSLVNSGDFVSVRAIAEDGSKSLWSASLQYLYNIPEDIDPGAVLTRPNLTYSNGALAWNLVSGASGYQIYKDGVLLSATTTSPFTISSDGVYQVRAYNVAGEYSVLSESVTVSNFSISASDVPERPESGNIIDWVIYIADTISYQFSAIGHAIQTVLQSTLTAIQNVIGYVGIFLSSIGDLFAWLPEELKTVLVSLITLGCMFGIFALFRK